MCPYLDHSSSTIVKDWSILGDILKVLMDDLLIQDPEPTEENPHPAVLPRLFTGSSITPPAWNPSSTRGKTMARSNRRGRVMPKSSRSTVQKSSGESVYILTLFCLSKICDIIKGYHQYSSIEY